MSGGIPRPLAVPLILISLVSAASIAATAPDPLMGPECYCLPTLLLAILTEGAVMLVCARIWRKPAGRLLRAYVLANCITVTALTLLTGLVFTLLRSQPDVIAALIAVEIAIWLFEAFVLRRFPGTQVSWREALAFSLVANLASLAAGFGLVRYASL